MRIAAAFHAGQAVPAARTVRVFGGAATNVGRLAGFAAIPQALRRVEADKLNEHRMN